MADISKVSKALTSEGYSEPQTPWLEMQSFLAAQRLNDFTAPFMRRLKFLLCPTLRPAAALRLRPIRVPSL